jgi:flavorubredoxin
VPVDPRDRSGRRVEVLATPVRLLTTVWLYDSETCTLFSSDSFGHVVRATRAEQAVLTEDAPDDTSLDDVRTHLLAKFDWLAHADTAPLVEGIRALFDAREVRVIAPTHGCVLVGRGVVERHLALYLEALASLGRTGRSR